MQCAKIVCTTGIRSRMDEGYVQISHDRLVGPGSLKLSSTVRQPISDDREEPRHEWPPWVVRGSHRMERQQNVLHEIFDVFAAEERTAVRHDSPNSRSDGVQQLAVRSRIAALSGLHQSAERIFRRSDCVHRNYARSIAQFTPYVTFSAALPNPELEQGAAGVQEKTMRSRIAASVVAGIIAGVVFGIMMHIMAAPTPDGGRMPVIAMVGQIVGSPTVTAGWSYHLFNSAVIGAIFGWLIAPRVRGYGAGFGWGAAYGVAWWIVGGLVLMPVLLGMPAFAPLMMPEMQMVAIGSLVGHLLYGLTLGGAVVALVRGAPVAIA